MKICPKCSWDNHDSPYSQCDRCGYEQEIHHCIRCKQLLGIDYHGMTARADYLGIFYRNDHGDWTSKLGDCPYCGELWTRGKPAP